MSIPGAGLLSLLRKNSSASKGSAAGEAAKSPPAAATPGEDGSSAGKFAARSSAVAALEAAVASGSAAADAAKAAPQGRAVPPGQDDYTYDLGARPAGEAAPQLPVTPVTLVASDYCQRHRRQAGADGSFIAYGLKLGHIRVLSRYSAARALLKGHATPLRDVELAPGAAGGAGLLASGGTAGLLIVWRLAVDGDAFSESQALRVQFSRRGGEAGDVLVTWRGGSTAGDAMLAVAVGGAVLLLKVPATGALDLAVNLDAPPPGLTLLGGWPAEDVTALAFSPDGSLLAAGGGSGAVLAWEVDADGSVTKHGCAVPYEGSGAVGSVSWLAGSQAAGQLLLVGDAGNAALELWRSPAGRPAGFQRLRRVRLGSDDLFCHLAVVPLEGLVVLADTASKTIFTLHFSGAR